MQIYLVAGNIWEAKIENGIKEEIITTIDKLHETKAIIDCVINAIKGNKIKINLTDNNLLDHKRI